MPDCGPSYFEPLVKDSQLSLILKEAIDIAISEFKDKNSDLKLPDYYGYINGSIYPKVIDEFIELKTWNEDITTNIAKGFFPSFPSNIDKIEDFLFFDAIFNEVSNAIDVKLDIFPLIRLDYLNFQIIQDIQFILNKYVINLEDKESIAKEINASIDDLQCFFESNHNFMNKYNSDNEDDIKLTPKEFFLFYRGLKKTPLWLEPVIKNNKNLGISPKKIHDHSVKTQEQLYVLIGWLTAKKYIGKNLKNHKYTKKKVFNEISKHTPKLFDHDPGGLDSAITRLFKVARKQGYCRFSEKEEK